MKIKAQILRVSLCKHVHVLHSVLYTSERIIVAQTNNSTEILGEWIKVVEDRLHIISGCIHLDTSPWFFD